MPVALRPSTPLEPILWPDGSEVAVRRPNTYAAETWDTEVAPHLEKGDSVAARRGLVKFVSMVVVGKSEDEIREQCDEAYLFLLAGYVNDRLQQAQAFVAELLGKTTAEAVPASPPPAPTGPLPAASAAPGAHL